MEALNSLSLPPGFGFHPTDSELISHYLKRKIHGIKIEYEVIPEVDIYKHEPWDLPAKCKVPTRDSKWHFFASRDKKYPNGSRSKRATEAGYWKSTGKDRNIKYQNRTIGTKKTLVFHEGRPPHGKRTVWIMHEYYINESECQDAPDLKDSYVLCRITKRDCWEMDGENVSKQGEKVKESSNEPDDVVSSVVKPNKSSSQFESIEDKDIEAIFTELLDPNFSATPTLTEVKSVPMEGLGSFALNNDPFDPHFIAEVSEDSHLLFPVEEYYDILQSESQGFDVFGQLDIGSLDALGVQQGDIFADLNDNYTGIQVRERGLKTSTSNLNQRIRLQASKMESQSEGCLSQIVEVKKDFRIVSSDGKQGPTEINAVQWDLNAKSNKSGLSSIRGFVRGICSFLSSRCSSASMKSFFLCACMGTTALIYIFSALVL